MVVITVVWGLVVGAGVVWANLDADPTAREQTTVAQALPTVDEAAADLAHAASADGLAVVAVSGLQRVEECEVTVFRRGARYERTVTAFVAPQTETALLERVASRLPSRYAVAVRPATARLVADAGLFVRVTGAVVAPGQVQFTIDTGDCRPEGHVPDADAAIGQRSTVEAVLARLGLSAREWGAYGVKCSNGGTLTTVRAVADQNPPVGDVGAALAGSVDSGVVVATADVFAFRVGTEQVGVLAEADAVTVTATTTC